MIKLFFILFLVPSFLLAQNYSAEVSVPGKNGSYLFNKAKEWFTENKSQDEEPITEDSAKGQIKGNGRFKFMVYSNEVAANMVTFYALTITVSDGKYKYSFDNIMVERGRKFPLSSFKDATTREGVIEMYKIGGMNTPSKKMIESTIDYNSKVVQQCESEIEKLILSLEDKMNS